jgi:hypothetical protein
MRFGKYVIPLAVVGLWACAPQQNTVVKTISVKTAPENAEVYLDGKFVGLAPVKFTVEFKKPEEVHTLVVKKYGFVPAKRLINRSTANFIFVRLQPAEKRKLGYLIPRYTPTGISFGIKYEYAYKDTVENSPNAYQVHAVLQLNNLNEILGPINARHGILVYTQMTPKALINSAVYISYLNVLNNIIQKANKLLQNPSPYEAQQLLLYIKQSEPYLKALEKYSKIFGNKIDLEENIAEIKSIAYILAGNEGLVYLLGKKTNSAKVVTALSSLSSVIEALQDTKTKLETIRPAEFYSELWEIKLFQGLSRVKLTNSQKKWIDTTPTITYDGKWVYFSSNRLSKNFNIYRINLSGGEGITQITNTAYANNMYPSITANGKLLAYQSLPAGAVNPQIWTIYTNGLLPSQLKSGEQPDICSDGSKIVFVKKNTITGKYQIWMMNADGTGETLLSQNPNVNDMYPHFSPDCKWIVFTSDDAGNKDIYIMRTDGSQRTQLTTNPSTDIYPVWGDDGNIYFVSNRGLVWGIWALRPKLNLTSY